MRVDIHAHYFPNEYLEVLVRHGSSATGIARGRGAGGTQKELQARLALMDAAGVDMQVLSASPQLPYFQQETHAVAAARLVNDLYADVIRRFPDRFVAFAATPLPHVQASLDELARALNHLGMVGVTMGTSVLGRSLVDPAFEPFYGELDRRRTVLFVHPMGVGACFPLIMEYGLTWPIGAPVEDLVATTHLILKGIPLRYPHLRIVIPHLGGGLPMLLQRLDHYRWAMAEAPEPPSITARRLWYDTVGHGNVAALRCAHDTLGPERLVLGSDFPYQSSEHYRRAVTYIQEAGLPAPDVQRILERNAATLLGLRAKG
jgi:aminocarboxymuconate-semialdehyde decarboxylase